MEFLRGACGFWFEVGTGIVADARACGGVVGRWGGFAAGFSIPGNVDEDVFKLGSLGRGRSAVLSAQSTCIANLSMCAYSFFSRRHHPK